MYLHRYIRPLRTLEDYEAALDLVGCPLDGSKGLK